MKLKRLIAITVVLTTLLSCTCIAGSTVFAADTDYTMYHFDGVLLNRSTYEPVDAGVLYGRTSAGYTANGSVKKLVYGIDSTADTGNARMSFHKSGYAADVTAPGIITYRAHSADSGKSGHYYEVTYPAFQLSAGKDLAATYTDFSLSDDVFSVSLDFRIPESVKTSDRRLFAPVVTPAGVTTRFDVSYDYTEEETGTITIAAAYEHFTPVWENPVEIEAGKWYNIDLRYTLNDDGVLVAGAYLDGKQFAYFLGDSEVSNCNNNLTFTHLWLGTYSLGGDIRNAVTQCDYDEILVQVLADKEGKAPSAEEPTEEEPENPPVDPEDPEVPDVTNNVVYGTPVVDGTSFSVDATISGYANVTGNVNAYVAIFIPSNGIVRKLVPTTVDTGSYVAGGTRTMTVSIDDEEVEAGVPIKVFFFNSLTSPTPLLPSFSGTIN